MDFPETGSNAPNICILLFGIKKGTKKGRP
jgi:hypothetical protein